MSASKRKRRDDATEPVLQKPRLCGPDDLTEDPQTNAKSSTTSQSADILARLQGLLDLSYLTDQSKIDARFESIAEILLHDVVLRLSLPSRASDGAGEPAVVDFDILELEFYLYKSGCHEDPFTHGSEEQRHSGRWYFHRAPRKAASSEPSTKRAPTAAGGYRGGTRKGLDLTLGGPVLSGSTTTTTTSRFFAPPTAPAAAQGALRGGILLRTLRAPDGRVLSGPSLLVDELLRLSGAPSVAALVTALWDGDTDAFPSDGPPRDGGDARGASLRLRAVDAPRARRTIYRSPRIGLDLSHASIPLPSGGSTDATLRHARTAFVARRYRCFVRPELLTANGRGQTFLGVYDSLSDADRQGPGERVAGRLAGAMGLSRKTGSAATVLKYLRSYEDGRGMALKRFVGGAGKGAGASPAPFLQMMGCLDALQRKEEA